MSWICFFLFLGFYPYLIYPVLIWLVGQVWPKPVQTGDDLYSVTVVIAAHNEASHIAQTVMNKLEQQYPKEKLSVVVISDASDDGTDEIVEALSQDYEQVTLISQTPRQGKTAALNRAIEQNDSELIVFSDANSIYAPNAIAKLVSRFADSRVGYVTGRMIYTSDESTTAGSGSSAFMRYENRLREWETRAGSVVGVDGGIDAVRRSLYQPMRADQLPDFVLPLKVIEQGYRVVFADNALLTEDALRATKAEFRMRVRVATRAIWALLDFGQLLNPSRYGVFSWQLLSHKWLRYMSFIPLALVVIGSWLIDAESTGLSTLRVGEIVFFSLAILAWLIPGLDKRLGIARWSLYFLLLNVASMVAVLHVLRGERFATWKPRLG